MNFEVIIVNFFIVLIFSGIGGLIGFYLKNRKKTWRDEMKAYGD